MLVLGLSAGENKDTKIAINQAILLCRRVFISPYPLARVVIRKNLQTKGKGPILENLKCKTKNCGIGTPRSGNPRQLYVFSFNF